MYSWGTDERQSEGEGIVQVITPLIPDNQYAVTFFKKIAKYDSENEVDMDKFYIVLMHCEDYERIHKYPSYATPEIPKNAQIIYCENHLNDRDWKQVLTCFTPKDDYDMIWIFPKQDPHIQYVCGIDFTGLELIDKSKFNAGPDPLPAYEFPNVTIGPEIPNCTLTNAVFIWNGPSGQVITPGANQQISVNASDFSQVGYWTLSMSIANSTSENNNCSKNCQILSSVKVSFELQISELNCDATLTSICNLIDNNTFQNPLSCNAQNPFTAGCIPKWTNSHGSPQTNVNALQIASGINHASMWAVSAAGVGGHPDQIDGEGIATGIPKLIPGHQYNLSFYKRYFSDLLNSTLRIINARGSKYTTINISDLKTGVYNCRITTNKGIENQKIIIKH